MRYDELKTKGKNLLTNVLDISDNVSKINSNYSYADSLIPKIKSSDSLEQKLHLIDSYVEHATPILDELKAQKSLLEEKSEEYTSFLLEINEEIVATGDSDGKLAQLIKNSAKINGLNDQLSPIVGNMIEKIGKNINYYNRVTPELRDKANKSGCYVATCVYGSYDCPQVWTLRRFRDDMLSKTWYGRLFIRTYYAISPSLVNLFGEFTWFKNLFKPTLDKMVENLNDKGVDNTPYQDKRW